MNHLDGNNVFACIEPGAIPAKKAKHAQVGDRKHDPHHELGFIANGGQILPQETKRTHCHRRGTEAEEIPSEFAGFDLFTQVARVDPDHLDLVAGGTTLSYRIHQAVGAAGFSGAGDLDRTRPLPVLLQEGMNSHPLLVWAFPYYVYALPSFDPRVKNHILPQAPFDRLDLTRCVMSGVVGGYLTAGDSVVTELLAWLAPYTASQVDTDMADLARFFSSYAEPSDRPGSIGISKT